MSDFENFESEAYSETRCYGCGKEHCEEDLIAVYDETLETLVDEEQSYYGYNDDDDRQSVKIYLCKNCHNEQYGTEIE